MLTKKPNIPYQLDLRSEEIVEVRSREEILSTLDKEGKLDALPFMPEMLEFCGKRMKVYKRAHKTCDTVNKTGGRRMKNAVHLEGIRCGGEAHGGCQAGCLIFWKEAWLKRVEPDAVEAKVAGDHKLSAASDSVSDYAPSCSEETLMKATRTEAGGEGAEGETFSCQATELPKATTLMGRWDLSQYIEDIGSGNARIGEVVRVFMFWVFTLGLKLRGFRIQIWLFNQLQRFRGGKPYPFTDGTLKKTPSEILNLQPGELVQIKTQDEIRSTVDVNGRNRGLSFDIEMTRFCGGEYRVLRRVDKIINEKTGKMMKMQNDCIILEGVFCTAQYSYGRRLCPRAIYSYWREIWLKRVE